MARILYIEDDPVQRDVLAQMLTLYGFEVDTASNGREGVAKAISQAPDLILTDSRMPGMTGFEAIAALRKNVTTADIPIIALSARVDRHYQAEALAAGVNKVFTKPIDIKQLIPTIKALLAQS